MFVAVAEFYTEAQKNVWSREWSEAEQKPCHAGVCRTDRRADRLTDKKETAVANTALSTAALCKNEPILIT